MKNVALFGLENYPWLLKGNIAILCLYVDILYGNLIIRYNDQLSVEVIRSDEV